MKIYRLRKIGTMLYYAGSRYGECKTGKASHSSTMYRRLTDLKNSVRLVKGFQPELWELQTYDISRPIRIERYDGKGYGMEVPDFVDLERARMKLSDPEVQKVLKDLRDEEKALDQVGSSIPT